MSDNQNYDFLIIGAGIIGLTIARELKMRSPKSSILIIEKEDEVALHSSGRNSGVLHAGFYYTADSLKAKFTVAGNQAMKDYCRDNNLQLNECGKVVVAKNENELEGLDTLYKRGTVNGVILSVIDEKELAEIEPNAKTYSKALYSPSTATVDPVEISMCLKRELTQAGIRFVLGDGYKAKLDKNTILTNSGGKYSADIIINCAGLYADKIARDFGFSKDYSILPFKGIYLKYTGDDMPVRTNIYPVPNLKNPFLGVHYTVTVNNHIKIGPTAIPAFWRENYSGISNFSLIELINIGLWESKLFLNNYFNFRQLAIEEMKKYWKPTFSRLAEKLVQSIDTNGFREWTNPGIRAQLLNTKTKELVQDFVVESDNKSIHILNAVSPAFTCSMSFSKYIVENFISDI